MADGTNIPGFTRTVSTAPGTSAVESKPAAPAPAPEVKQPAPSPNADASASATETQSDAQSPENKSKDAGAASRLAAMRKREQAIARKQQAWQAEWQRREQEIAAQRQEIEAARKEIEAFRKERDELRSNPQKWLEKGGFSYDDVTKQVVNEGNVDPSTLVAAERERLNAELERVRNETKQAIETERKERERLARAAQEREQRENQQRINEFYSGVVEHVRQSGDKYPLTNALERQHEVAQVIDAFYRQTWNEDVEAARAEGRQPRGRIMTADEAAGRVEAYYRDQYARAEKVLRAKQPAQQDPAVVVPAPADASATTARGVSAAAGSPSGQRPTVSNDVVTTPPVQRSGGVPSEEERMANARRAWDNATAARRAQS